MTLGGWARVGWLVGILAACGFPRPDPLPDGGADDTSYQLLAASPAIAATGTTLTLEGTFAATATVQFPGGVSQPATLAGAHRATVVVPAGATAGDLIVTTGGATLGPLPFRRTTFALGLQLFRGAYEQTDVGRQRPLLRTARAFATADVIDHWLYVVGGAGAGPVGSVERATINADGTLGALALAPELTLREARSRHASVVTGRSLLVIGGVSGTTALASIERATPGADGSLAGFTTLAAHLVTPRAGHAAVVIGDALYVIGGEQADGTRLSSVERATITANGGLGELAIVPGVELATPRTGHTLEVIGSAVYVLGGDSTDRKPLATVERAEIGADGQLGPFRAVSAPRLAIPRTGHRTVRIGDGIYALGGATTTGPTADVERAPLGVDGTLADFVRVTDQPLTVPRSGGAIAVVRTSLFAIGGSDGSTALRSVEHASLDANGSVGALAASASALVTPRTGRAGVVIGDFTYALGTLEAGNPIERATVAPDGGLGGFATVPGIALTRPRADHGMAVVGSWLYAIGGAGQLASVERAAADRELATFAAVAPALTQARSGHASVVIGDFVYVIGGLVNNARIAGIERAPILADGSLGAFAVVPGVALNTPRNLFSVAVTDAYVYVIGGFADNLQSLTSLERAPIAADGTLGPFELAGNLLAPRAAPAVTAIGANLYVFGGFAASTFRADAEHLLIKPDGSLAPQVNSLVDLPTARARHFALTIGNQVYLLGGQKELGGTTNTTLALEQAELR